MDHLHSRHRARGRRRWPATGTPPARHARPPSARHVPRRARAAGRCAGRSAAGPGPAPPGRRPRPAAPSCSSRPRTRGWSSATARRTSRLCAARRSGAASRCRMPPRSSARRGRSVTTWMPSSRAAGGQLALRAGQRHRAARAPPPGRAGSARRRRAPRRSSRTAPAGPWTTRAKLPLRTLSEVQDARLAFPREQLRGRTARGGLLNAPVPRRRRGPGAAAGPDRHRAPGPGGHRALRHRDHHRDDDRAAAAGGDRRGLRRSSRRPSRRRSSSGRSRSSWRWASPSRCWWPRSRRCVAAVYGDDRLLWLTLAVSYLPLAFALQAPQWVFHRRMDFLRLRLLQFSIPAVTFAVTVPLAAVTDSVWALVVGPFVGNAVAVTAALVVSPYRLRLRFDRRGRSPVPRLLVADLRHRAGHAGGAPGAGAGVRPRRRPGGRRLHHPRGHAHPLRRPRRPHRGDHHLSRDLRGAGSPGGPARAVREVHPRDDDLGTAVLRGC